MHRPRHARTILSVQMAALLLCLNRVLILSAVVLLIASVVTSNTAWSIWGLILAGVALVVAVIQWMVSANGKCPLCLMPVLSRRGCSKHRNAKSIAGSHRFPVAFGVLFKGHFRCPYCNEPTLLELKSTASARRP